MSIDNKTIDSAQNRLVSGNTIKDGSGQEYRIVLNDEGHLVVNVVGGTLQTNIVGGTISGDYPQNLEAEDDNVPAGENHESVISILYAYDPVNGQLRRVHVDASGNLKVYTP